MKRWMALAGIILLGIASVVVSEHRKVDVPASPAALLYLVADTEQELMRMPVTFTRMSDQEEIRIGDELARSYRMKNDQAPEVSTVERYLTQVGSQLARHAHRKLPYRFHYLPNPYLINAFALPGGHVYVGQGLLALMDSEDELAAVVGHEIEHIDHYHCAERVQQEEALRKIPLGGLVALPVEVFEAGYSKDQELEADREGTRLAVETGYSANGAIRIFESYARLYGEYQVRAKTPQGEVSEVALETLEGYFRSHPLPSERIAQVQQLMAREGWAVRPERDLAVAYIFLSAKAQIAFEAHRYPEAEQLARRSLEVQPEQPRVLELLARAQFAQANFSAAAATYRKLLKQDSSNPEMIVAYAQTLAASDRRNAVVEFRRWAESSNGHLPKDAEVAEAGLALLSGNPEAARSLEAGFTQGDADQTPRLAGELGWWHYLNGDYPKAIDLLSEEVQQRPWTVTPSLRLAWAKMEVREYRDALEVLTEIRTNRQIPPEGTMARAVASWQSQEHEEALRYFGSAVRAQPEWENSNWVRALYSPRVAESIVEIETKLEQQRARVAVNR
jgi:beta-barrel assembly-enhancing protease